MSVAPDGRPLIGSVVRLDLVQPDDAPGLFAALDDERVWAAGYGGGAAGRPADPAAMAARLVAPGILAGEQGERVMYVARLVADGPLGAAGTVVGTSSLGDIDIVNERVHLGWTAYAPAFWATAVNPECKLLLLGHAFDDCGFNRVKIQTDRINTRSQAAIAKLGATREGVLRQHVKRADGSWRDTVVFSILRDEWPAAREGLFARLAAASTPAVASSLSAPGQASGTPRGTGADQLRRSATIRSSTTTATATAAVPAL